MSSGGVLAAVSVVVIYNGQVFHLRYVMGRVAAVGNDDGEIPVCCIRSASLAVPEGVNGNLVLGRINDGAVTLVREELFRDAIDGHIALPLLLQAIHVQALCHLDLVQDVDNLDLCVDLLTLAQCGVLDDLFREVSAGHTTSPLLEPLFRNATQFKQQTTSDLQLLIISVVSLML